MGKEITIIPPLIANGKQENSNASNPIVKGEVKELVKENIRKGLNLVEISKVLGLSKQALNYHVYRLKKSGEIHKIGRNNWSAPLVKVSNPHQRGVAHPHTPPHQKRGHGFVFQAKFKKSKDWGAIITYRKWSYKEISQGYRIIIDNHKIWLCSKSIIIYFPKGMSFYGESAKDTYIKATLHCQNILKNLDVKIYPYELREIRNHFSEIENEISKECEKNKQKLFIKDNKENAWLLCDNSFNLHELETIFTPTAIKDMDIVISPFMNKLRENPLILDNFENSIKGLITIQNTEVEKWSYYAETIKKHIGAMDNITQATKELKETIQQLNPKFNTIQELQLNKDLFNSLSIEEQFKITKDLVRKGEL